MDGEAKPVRIAVASSTQIAADAGADLAQAGGNAVDAAIAASLVQLVTEPGIVSLAAGAFIVVWPPDEHPVMVDGASEMPGRNFPAERLGKGGRDVVMNYGGGAPTTVGYASVATPGALAGYALASQRFGGVSAVHFRPPDRFEMAADIRRTGGTALSLR